MRLTEQPLTDYCDQSSQTSIGANCGAGRINSRRFNRFWLNTRLALDFLKDRGIPKRQMCRWSQDALESLAGVPLVRIGPPIATFAIRW